MQEVLGQEALALALSVCEIVPTELDEAVKDYATLAIVHYEPTSQHHNLE